MSSGIESFHHNSAFRAEVKRLSTNTPEMVWEALAIPRARELVVSNESATPHAENCPMIRRDGVAYADASGPDTQKKEIKKKKKPFLAFIKETLTDDVITWEDIIIFTVILAITAGVTALTFAAAAQVFGVALVMKFGIGALRFLGRFALSKARAMLIASAMARLRKGPVKNEKKGKKKKPDNPEAAEGQ